MKFQEAFNFTLRLLLWAGLYLNITREIVKNRYIIMICRIYGWLLTIYMPVHMVTVTLPLVLPGRHFSERLFSLTVGIAALNIIFKFYWFLYKVPLFKQLITIWNEFNEIDFYPELKKKLLQERKKSTDLFIRNSAVLFIFLMIVVCSSPYYTRTIEHPTVIEYSKETPDFEIFVSCEMIVRVGFCLVVHSYNCFLMQIVAFQAVLCNYLSQSLKITLTSLRVTEEGQIFLIEERNLPWKNKNASVSSEEKHLMSYREICREAENNLRIWIKLHQILLRFHDLTKEIYGASVCLELVGLMLLLCVFSLMALNYHISVPNLLNGVVFCSSIYTISYITCWYGDMTQLSSENLCRNAFGGSWYLYTRNIRTIFQIIIMRCRTQMILTAFGLFPINSRTFGVIIRHSYSFFMFLLQVVSR